MFSGLFNRDLWTPDEPRIAAISLEMSRTGDMIVPHLAGKPFIEKPPLYFAINAFFIKWFGATIGNTNAPRLVTAFFGVGTVWMTFLLSRRLFGKSSGLSAAAVLVTMTGFILNFHWIRSDCALCFFVIAAIWSFSEVYFAKRPWFCLPAGFFVAGAFLTKGFIGPILIGIPWLGMFGSWMLEIKKRGLNKKNLFIGHHLFGLAIMALLSGAWMYLLLVKGGANLWHEWFWVNHVGRLLGNAEAKAHIRTGQPFYYISQLAVNSLPWFPLILVWTWTFFKRILKHARPSKEDIFLLIWGAGAILLLSLSATKRNIYLAPVLPVFAIMCARMMEKPIENKVLKGYLLFWAFLALILLAALTVVPFFEKFYRDALQTATTDFLMTFGYGNIISGIGFVICLLICIRWIKGHINFRSVVLLTSILFICLLTIPVKAIDMEKSMQADILRFISRIPVEERPRIAGYNFNETMQGCFYYYGDWPVKQISDENRVRKIVNGDDSDFDAVIINRDCSRQKAIDFIDKLIKGPYQIIEEAYTGNKRRVFWIKGNNSLCPSRNR